MPWPNWPMSLCAPCQGRHGWQGPQGLGLAWILQNRKRRRQWLQATDMPATVVDLSAKNWPWRQWLPYKENPIRRSL